MIVVLEKDIGPSDLRQVLDALPHAEHLQGEVFDVVRSKEDNPVYDLQSIPGVVAVIRI